MKSAVGIGTLLAQGIGDTIRVSLSEAPEAEIPVASALVDYIGRRAAATSIAGDYAPGYDCVAPSRRQSIAVGNVGGDQVPVAVGVDSLEDYILVDADRGFDYYQSLLVDNPIKVVVVESHHVNVTGAIQAFVHAMSQAGLRNPVVSCIDYGDASADDVAIMAAADFGTLLLNGIRDGIWLKASRLSDEDINRLSLGILQATRLRITRTEYISCPGCGRTLFDLQSTLHAVKEATSHLTGLKIGVMGCVVNGPGEMADADYGYVGAAVDHVSLYKGKECIEKNIPASQAISRLIDLIKANGDWRDP